MADDGDDRREAAACVERGVERYAEGQYAAAQNELEAALALNPGHPRALECLSWVREIAAGRRHPSSDTYQAVVDDPAPRPQRAVLTHVVSQPVQTGRTNPDLFASDVIGPHVPAPSPQRLASNPVLRAIVPLPAPPRASSSGVPRVGLPGVTLPDAAVAVGKPAVVVNPPAPEPMERSQLDDAPESVTREWSTIATVSLPQLDVPELSEEQIASLLDLDHGQGFTLSAGPPPATAFARPADESLDDADGADEDDEVDRTHVRLHESTSATSSSGEYEVQVSGGHDEDEDPPALAPLTAPEPELPRITQTRIQRPDPSAQLSTDDAASLSPTSPFGHPRLPTPAMQPAVASPEALEAALQGRDRRRIVELADGIVQSGMPGHEELLTRAYEHVVGDLFAVPRYGKATPDLDSRSAFLLSRMDGSMSLDDLLDISGMPRADALRVIARLIVAGVVVTQR